MTAVGNAYGCAFFCGTTNGLNAPFTLEIRNANDYDHYAGYCRCHPAAPTGTATNNCGGTVVASYTTFSVVSVVTYTKVVAG